MPTAQEQSLYYHVGLPSASGTPIPRCPPAGHIGALSLPHTHLTGPSNSPLTRVQGGGNSLSLGSAEAHTIATIGRQYREPGAEHRSQLSWTSSRALRQDVIASNSRTRSAGAVSTMVVYSLSGLVAAWKGLVSRFLVLASLTNGSTRLPAWRRDKS